MSFRLVQPLGQGRTAAQRGALLYCAGGGLEAEDGGLKSKSLGAWRGSRHLGRTKSVKNTRWSLIFNISARAEPRGPTYLLDVRTLGIHLNYVHAGFGDPALPESRT